jgi:hypothetical protein
MCHKSGYFLVAGGAGGSGGSGGGNIGCSGSGGDDVDSSVCDVDRYSTAELDQASPPARWRPPPSAGGSAMTRTGWGELLSAITSHGAQVTPKAVRSAQGLPTRPPSFRVDKRPAPTNQAQDALVAALAKIALATHSASSLDSKISGTLSSWST